MSYACISNYYSTSIYYFCVLFRFFTTCLTYTFKYCNAIETYVVYFNLSSTYANTIKHLICYGYGEEYELLVGVQETLEA